jgi:hypothetical protein
MLLQHMNLVRMILPRWRREALRLRAYELCHDIDSLLHYLIELCLG